MNNYEGSESSPNLMKLNDVIYLDAYNSTNMKVGIISIAEIVKFCKINYIHSIS